MSKKSSLYDRVKTMDQLLHSLNDTITHESKLLSEMNNTSQLFKDLYSEANKAFGSMRSAADRMTPTDSRNYLNELEDASDVLTSIDRNVRGIYDSLRNNSRQERHNDANPNSGRNRRNSRDTGDGEFDLKSFLENSGKSILTYVITKATQAAINAIGSQAASTMSTSYNMSQISGNSKQENAEVKDTVNGQIGWSSIYSRSEEYERIAQVAASTGFDDLEAIAEYSKAIAVGVESMDLNLGTVSDLVYTMEKRGTFSSEELESIINEVYAYSSTNTDVTPEELMANLDKVEDYLEFGALGKIEGFTAEDVSRERSEVLATRAAALEQGMSAKMISELENLFYQVDEGLENLPEYAQKMGITHEQAKQFTSTGDLSGWVDYALQAASQTANNADSTNVGYFWNLLESQFGDLTYQEKAALQGYDSSMIGEVQVKAFEAPTAEEGAEDYSRDGWDQAKTFFGNFFSNLSDTLSEHGIGGSTFSLVSGAVGSLGLASAFKNLGHNIKLPGFLSNLFKRGSSAADDVTSAAANAASVADDVISAGANSVDDVLTATSNAALYSMDDVTSAAANAASTTASTALGSMDEVATGAASYLDDVASAAINSSDEVASAVGGTLSKVAKGAQVVGIAIEGVTTFLDAKDAYDKGDTREVYGEVGEGVGSIAGSLGGAAAGAAIGTMILPGIGTAVGGIIGGVAGSLGAGKAGREIGEALSDATHEVTEYNDDVKAQLKYFYDEVSSIYAESGNNAAQEYTLNNIVPYLNHIGVSESITDGYKWDVGKPDFMIDYEKNKFMGYYASGTPYLPSDGIVYAHEGEAIIPASLNPNNPDSILEEIESFSVSKSDIRDMYNLVRELSTSFKEFVEYMKDRDAQQDTKEAIAESKATVLSRFSGTSSSGYISTLRV